ncbi:MAG: methyl-accepting chemotaxis protein [Gemmatimonadota bacterium]
MTPNAPTFLRLRSLRRRLFVGFGLLVALFGAAGMAARAAIGRMSDVIGDALSTVQTDSRLSARLTVAITDELAAADRYVESRDAAALARADSAAATARTALREMRRIEGQTPRESELLAAIETRLTAIEAAYDRAGNMAGDPQIARARAVVAEARDEAVSLMEDVRALEALKGAKVEEASRELRRDAEQRTLWTLIIMAAAAGLGLVIVVSAVGGIVGPMRQLTARARALSAGDFTTRSGEDLPVEFQELADAMNGAAASLSRVVSVSTVTADEVASSARDLANVSEQISASATQMAASMTEISGGADGQVRQLRNVDEALRSIRANADEALHGAGELRNLASDIEESARAKRTEIARSLGILSTVRRTVRDAASEVHALETTAESINRLVASVGRIAEQTDLLALNAAIEAARAGAAGRGFGVVADEVRKLAEQAQAAADDVAQLTRTVTSQVELTTRAMETGVSHVDEIEGLSRDVDHALASIGGAAERTREAAGGAAEKAERNALIVVNAVRSLESVARTAESYAAAAQQVSATTQEQSAACEQMSSASTQLMQGSEQLRQLVGALRIGAQA